MGLLGRQKGKIRCSKPSISRHHQAGSHSEQVSGRLPKDAGGGTRRGRVSSSQALTRRAIVFPLPLTPYAPPKPNLRRLPLPGSKTGTFGEPNSPGLGRAPAWRVGQASAARRSFTTAFLTTRGTRPIFLGAGARRRRGLFRGIPVGSLSPNSRRVIAFGTILSSTVLL